MKTRLNLIWIAAFVFTLLGNLQIASAFYNPAAQRWLNRDPLGEYGGINLFGFVSQNPISHFDPFGLQRGSPSPPPIPPSPAPDSCDPERRKQIEDALKNACDKINNGCPKGGSECEKIVAKAQKACKENKKPKIRCAKPGDPYCTGCAYTLGNEITICPSSWPASGDNCQGHGGPMNLECVLIHELEHVGANSKNPDDANTLQKCLGCPYGEPHKK